MIPWEAIATIAGAIISYVSQKETNEQMVDLSSTAYRRAAHDMAGAGINPLMAGKVGGADTPGLQNPGASLGSSVASAGQLYMTKKLNEQILNKNKIELEILRNQARTSHEAATQAKYESDRMSYDQMFREIFMARDFDYKHQEWTLGMEKMRADIAVAREMARLHGASAEVKRLEIPQSMYESGKYKLLDEYFRGHFGDRYGEYLKYLPEYIRGIGGTAARYMPVLK